MTNREQIAIRDSAEENQTPGCHLSRSPRTVASDLETLRHIELLNETDLFCFARERGLSIPGVANGEQRQFWARGWLSADSSANNELLFHPFRAYVLHELLTALKHNHPVMDRKWTETAELAILLEPVYWSQIVDPVLIQLSCAEHMDRLAKYKVEAIKTVRSLDAEIWRGVHKRLREVAARIDSNADLYVLLRLSLWAKRADLRGQISGALWIRHMAEVIRRGFEEAHGVLWDEEDRAFGRWPEGSRARMFGLERPYDDPMESKPFITYEFGLATRGALRWYVEGATEYSAIFHALEEPSKFGIELVNLSGEIASDGGTDALKLVRALAEDSSQRRFSNFTFDTDLDRNNSVVLRCIARGQIVGYVSPNDPDFEFENFSLEELVEVAARMDERLGFDGGKVRTAGFAGVISASEFAERYLEVSERRRKLKGTEWGESLATYAHEQPTHPKGGMRPFLAMVSDARSAWCANYGASKEPLRTQGELASKKIEKAKLAKAARRRASKPK